MPQNPYITRKLEQAILKYLKTPEILAVVGPRQCGKTTLLRHIFEALPKDDAVFLTFEDKKVLDSFFLNTDEFVELYVKPYKYIFIDEFQYVKKGGKILKYIFDTVPRKLLISGSSSIDLTVQAVKYLVGRIFVLSLFPLDFEEFLSFKKPNLLSWYRQNKFSFEQLCLPAKLPSNSTALEQIRDCYQEYVIYGGYPRVVLAGDIAEKRTVLQNIYNTYFLREVKDILGLVDDFKLARLIKALALQIGSLIQYQEISRTSELSYPTVKGYLNFLEKTFIGVLVRPYFKNKRTEIVKNPKIYFCDTGLRNYIVDDFRSFDSRTDAGALLENAFAMQLLKQNLTFNFWRTKTKSEIDFVVNLSQNYQLALEIKKNLRAGDIKSKSVGDFRNRYPDIKLFFGIYEKTELGNENIIPLPLF